MLIDKLKQLQTEQQPQSLDELFSQSKEGMMSDRIIGSVNNILPQMKEKIIDEVRMIISEEVKNQVGMIKIRHGEDGKTPIKGVDYFDGEDGTDGKDAVISKEEIVSEIMKKIPPLSVGGKRGGGGSTVITEDLSSQANGVLKTFTTTKKIGTPLLLVSTQFPTVLRPTVDYTNTQTSITLDAGVDAPASGQTFLFIYVEG